MAPPADKRYAIYLTAQDISVLSQVIDQSNASHLMVMGITKIIQEQLTAQVKAETDKAALAARYEDKQRSAAELEQVHQLLDAVPGAPARKSGDETTASWERVDRTLMTRLAAWLAVRQACYTQHRT